MKSHKLRWISISKKIVIFILLASMPIISSCNLLKLSPPDWMGQKPFSDPPSGENEGPIPVDPGDGGGGGNSGEEFYPGDELYSEPAAGQEDGPGIEGELKPVGFVNYGEFNATVRAWTFVPLGKAEGEPAPVASTVSSANSGSGTWPNTSRFISVPMGTYTWCIDWEEGDLDEDGNFDYFHYIDEDPTLLDENDSDELDFAEQVAISAPPSMAAVYEGKCSQAPVEKACLGQGMEVDVYSYFALEENNKPEIFTYTNTADYSAPDGITVAVGGVSTPWGSGMILWQGGDWVEATTAGLYTAIGGQIHGDVTIGWARALFDGVEVWRGDTSTFSIAEGRYGVYVEVSCFPPGNHTIRIEALGINGSGGGMSVPVANFGFRP